MTAKLYRVLRVLRLVTFHPHGHVEIEDGIVKFNGAVNKVALSLRSFPQPALSFWNRPSPIISTRCGRPIHEPISRRCSSDISRTSSPRSSASGDEDCMLYQFRPKYAFNRHFRFDCDNPRRRRRRTALSLIETGPAHGDAALYPIDFYVTANDALHIVPAEALCATESCRWRSSIDGAPAFPRAARCRPISACVFARETPAPNQPMT